MRINRIFCFCIFIILSSCDNRSQENQDLNIKSIYDTVQNVYHDKTGSIEQENSLVLESDSLYKLKNITIPWINSDSIPSRNEFILFENGRLKYIIENKVCFDRKYSLVEDSSYSLGKYLLCVNSEKYHSVDFYKDSIIVYQNAEDESFFIFLRCSNNVMPLTH